VRAKTPIIALREAALSIGDKTLFNEANISIADGDRICLVGRNGSGKSTLLKVLAGEREIDSGQRFVQPGSKIGYLPEERGLYKKMKVGEQALYLAQLKGMPYNEALIKLREWFEKLNIVEWWHKKVEELSKGMAQKIQFVVTVIHKPKLLIFDEPFSGFDPINASIIRDEIIKLKNDGTTIIFSTHRMESVEEICDHIALINKSKTILEGPINKIKNDFQEEKYEVILDSEVKFKSEKFDVLHQDKNKYQIRLNSQSEILNLDKIQLKLKS